jgi:glycerol kinase
MYEDSGTRLVVLKVDGGGTKNDFLMQFQSDMIDVPVVAPKVTETTAIGAAFAAGLAVGVWESLDEIQSLWALDKHWEPKMDKVDRERYWKGWKKSVKKSFGWTKDVEDEPFPLNRFNLAIAIIGSIGIGMLIGSRWTRK